MYSFARVSSFDLIIVLSLLAVAALPLVSSVASSSNTSSNISVQGLSPSGPGGYVNSTVNLPSPMGIGVNPSTGYVYVAGRCNGPCTNLPYNYSNPQSKIYVIGASGGVSASILIPGPYYSSQVAVNPNTNEIWVASLFGSAGAEYDVINGNTNQVVHTGAITGGPAPSSNIALNPNTNTVYVVAPNNGCRVLVINGATYQQSCINLPPCHSCNPGAYVDGLAVNPITNTIYLTASFAAYNGSYPGYLFFVNGATNTVTKNITLNAGNIAVDPATNHLFAAVGQNLDVLDATSGSVIASIPLGDQNAAYVAVIDNGQMNNIYVSSYNYQCSNGCRNDYLSVINGNTYQITNTIDLGSIQSGGNGVDVATNPSTNTIYTECCGSDFLIFKPSSTTTSTLTQTSSSTSTRPSSTSSTTFTSSTTYTASTTDSASSTSSSSSTGQSTASTPGIQTSTTSVPQAPPPGNTTTGVGNSAFPFSITQQQLVLVAVIIAAIIIVSVGSMLFFRTKRNI